jgi:hypothetical protein
MQNTTFSLSAFSFEEKVYISIKTETKNESSIEIPIEVKFSAFDKDKQLINQEKIETVILQKEEFIRTIFTDYDIISVEVEITNTDTEEKILLSTSVTQN